MKAARFSFLILVFSIGFTGCVPPENGQPPIPPAPPENTSTTPEATPTPTPVAEGTPEFDAGAWFSGRVREPDQHTAIVVTLEPGRNFAEHNPDTALNPASLIKLATTLAALKKLGADHRFAVGVLTSGSTDEQGTLDGDLYFRGRSPIFNEHSAALIAEELKKRGIRRIRGKLYVSPDFSFNFRASAEDSARALAENLRLEKRPQTGVAEQPAGSEIFVVKSYPLRQILLYMNTFSSNVVAHDIGDAVGGAEGVRQFLIGELGFQPDTVKLDTTSGLEDNALTGRQVLSILRALDAELKRQGLEPVDVMPMAAEGASTLDRRLDETGFETAAVGKTGTLSAADGGVGMASLAGFIYTKNNGPIAFVLMSQGAETAKHKKLHDEFLKEVLQQRIEPAPFGFDKQRRLLNKEDLVLEVR